MAQIRKSLVLVTLLSVFAVIALAACSSSEATPTATASPTEVPTATPVPIKIIAINPEEDPEGFLAALPASEVDCAIAAVGGREQLVSLISSAGDEADGISDTQLRVLASCIGSDTMRAIVIGQLDLESGGLSDATVACIAQYTAGINFAGVFSGQVIQTDAIVSTLQALFCLSPEERAALENSGTNLVSIDTPGGIDALECAVDGAGPEGIQVFADMFGPDGEVDPLAVSKFMPLMIDCGLVDEEAFAESGMTPVQLSCMFEKLDPEALATLMTATGSTSGTPDLSVIANLFTALDECGIDLQALIDAIDPYGGPSTTITPDISVDLLFCLTENGVSPGVASNYAAGLVDASDPAISAALTLCADDDAGGEPGEITVPDGSGGTTTFDPAVLEALPITVEQAQCLINEIGIEQLAGIADGTVSPLTALAALSACNISITDLLGGLVQPTSLVPSEFTQV